MRLTNGQPRMLGKASGAEHPFLDKTTAVEKIVCILSFNTEQAVYHMFRRSFVKV